MMNRPNVKMPLYEGRVMLPSMAELAFDHMTHAPIRKYLGEEELRMLYTLATNPEYKNASRKSKFDVYDAIMGRVGFKRFHLGTNRIVYNHIFDPTFLLKIGLDNIGIHDNLAEFNNQQFIKPMCTKVFDVSECGTVCMVERVEPYTSEQDFANAGYEIESAIQSILRGIYIMEDIGNRFFMNWGYRKNFGPVILDFPYIYRIRKERFICIAPDPEDHSKVCGGHIYYDSGYNQLLCSKCGQRYAAKDLGSDINYYLCHRLVKEKGDSNMDEKKSGVIVKRGNTVVFSSGHLVNEIDFVERRQKPVEKKTDVKRDDHNKKSEKKEYTTRYVVARPQVVSEQKEERISLTDIVKEVVEDTSKKEYLMDDDKQSIKFVANGKSFLDDVKQKVFNNTIKLKHKDSYEIMNYILYKSIVSINTPTLIDPEALLKLIDDSLDEGAGDSEYVYHSLMRKIPLVISYTEFFKNELRDIINDGFDEVIPAVNPTDEEDEEKSEAVETVKDNF